MRLTGTVKWFDARKGYGFIESEDGTNYYVHFSQIQMDGFRKLRMGESVSFDGVDGERGLMAENVCLE